MTQKEIQNPSSQEMMIYRTDDDDVKVEIVLSKENLWLTQAKMAELFNVNSQAITKHLQRIYAEGELSKEATCSKMEQVQKEGIRQVTRLVRSGNVC